jgi:hypothetical protein
MFRESKRLFVSIIYATYQNMFEGEVLILARGIVFAGLQELAQGIFAVDRHDFRAHRIRGAMK